jgi:hypothetical protein
MEYKNVLKQNNFIEKLCSNITNKLNRSLTQVDKKIIIEFLKNINHDIFKKHPFDNILLSISELLVNQIKKTPCKEDNAINLHEMLKNEMGVRNDIDDDDDNNNNNNNTTNSTNSVTQITNALSDNLNISSFLGASNLSHLQTLITGDKEKIKKRASIMLDTRYRLITNNSSTFTWNFVNNENVSDGTVNVSGNINNIISMRLSPIRIPYTASADNDYSRITLLVNEFSSQSFIGQEGRRFHFINNAIVDNRWIIVCPENFNDGYFYFRTPLNFSSTITVSFGSPLDSLDFDSDRATTTVTAYGAVTTFQTNINHNLETGDLVYISNFNTLNNITESTIVSSINRPLGHTIDFINNNTFTINVNSTSIVTPSAGTTIVVTALRTVTLTVPNGISFSVFFRVGDRIVINGISYTISVINSATVLTLASDAVNGTFNNFSKNNTNTANVQNVYFGSKRIFIPLQFEYLD